MFPRAPIVLAVSPPPPHSPTPLLPTEPGPHKVRRASPARARGTRARTCRLPGRLAPACVRPVCARAGEGAAPGGGLRAGSQMPVHGPGPAAGVPVRVEGAHAPRKLISRGPRARVGRLV